MSNTAFQPGEVVIIPHAPYSNGQGTKARPVLIVSSSSFNDTHADVVCVAITSQSQSLRWSAVDISDSSEDFAATGLRCSSWVKCGAIFAYEASRIRRRLGRVPQSLLDRAKQTIRSIFDL